MPKHGTGNYRSRKGGFTRGEVNLLVRLEKGPISEFETELLHGKRFMLMQLSRRGVVAHMPHPRRPCWILTEHGKACLEPKINYKPRPRPGPE